MSEATLHTRSAQRAAALAVTVAALGYFVDIYDLILFGMVRKPSLTELGVAPADLVARGADLLSTQMYGMLIGGIFWGVLGDKRGRLSVLFGSITLYSLANLANGMCTSLDQYSICRLVAGFGLAGELGAGVTLVSELMGAERRGVGTTLVAAIGVAGGLAAGLIGGAIPSVPHPGWRVAYFIGGGLGLALLALRIGVVESGMFKTAASDRGVARGSFFALFTQRRRLVRYLALIAVGVPVWYVIGIAFTFADTIGKQLGFPDANPATALFFCYGGCSLGGLACGLISQALRSRKKALGGFLAATVVVMSLYYTIGGASAVVFYTLCGLGGAASGYWAVFVSTAAELFGTNLRATVTTTVPNFVRGSLVGVLAVFRATSGPDSLGVIGAAVAVGAGTVVIAVIGLVALPETFGVDLDYVEEDLVSRPSRRAA